MTFLEGICTIRYSWQAGSTQELCVSTMRQTALLILKTSWCLPMSPVSRDYSLNLFVQVLFHEAGVVRHVYGYLAFNMFEREREREIERE